MTGAVSHISSRTVKVIIGVDTHKDQHVAVALDERGVRLDEKRVLVATCGYEELERWSRDLGQVHAVRHRGYGFLRRPGSHASSPIVGIRSLR